MNAIANGARSKSTLLTAAAGLLLLVTAVVMMVIAAPRTHQAGPGSVTPDRLAAWVWVTRDHQVLLTPGTVAESTRTGRALLP
jgi:DMSO/TMAO reductase YedYZ molybdopterin-dependent catalytic subunit